MSYNSKHINVNHVVNHLKVIFEKAISDLPKDNSRGTLLHKYQTEFCYYIDEIERGPNYMISKIISECNMFIDQILNKA